MAGRKKTLGNSEVFKIHVTFPEEAFKLISEEAAEKKQKVRKQKTALKAFDIWAKQALSDNPNLEIVYRQQERRSFAIDLDDETVFGE